MALLSGLPIGSALAAAPCVEVPVKGLGEACARADGFFQVAADRGTGLLVHGNDPLSVGDEPVAVDAPRAPQCVADGGYRMLVIYARPADVASRYEERLSAIRGLVSDANALLNVDAQARGATADYRVACTSAGAILVKNEVLPTPAAGDSFSTVVSDLRVKGYTSVTDKLWVWYEGSAGAGIAGTGHLYWDESRSVNNRNNAGPGSSSTFAVLWGQAAGYSVRTWMHENGHNLGAVQQNAPDSSGQAHCIDGQDIMCYRDSSTTPYNPDVCTDRTHFDCGHDSYFDPDPESGTYLANNWNLGWRMNRFIDLRPTIAPTASSATASEGDGIASITLRRSGVIDVDAPVTWTVDGGTADEADTDARTGSVTIPPGERLATISIPITSDDVDEPDETVQIAFSSTAAGMAIPPITLTILDDDGSGEEPAPTPALGPMPDVAIGPKLNEMRGQGVLRPDGVGQIIARRVRPGGNTTYFTRVGNDGDVPITLRYQIDSGQRAAVVVSDANTGKKLRWVTTSARLEFPMAPGRYRILRLDVKIARGTKDGMRRAFKATLFPRGDAYDERDVAFGVAKVRA